MKIYIYILLISTLGLKCLAQDFVEPDKMKSFNITVNYPDYTVKTQMLKDHPKKLKLESDLSYHWYISQKIMETKGGYDGKLLHGYYKSFYLTDQLFESGEFDYGVKSGEWKNWYPDGKLKEITNWKNGRKNGKYTLYSNLGVLMATGEFKKDELTGEFKTYDNFGKESSVRKYKNGKEIIKKVKVKKEKVNKEKAPKENSENSSEPIKEKKKWFGNKKDKEGKKEEKTKATKSTTITT
jgi:hypothetical protein